MFLQKVKSEQKPESNGRKTYSSNIRMGGFHHIFYATGYSGRKRDQLAAELGRAQYH